MLAKRWRWAATATAFVCVAAQAWMLMSWGLPWWVAALAVAAVFVQGALAGFGQGYHKGLWDNDTIYRDAMKLQANEFIKATPPQLGEAYTQLVTHRDRGN